jgi:hypothetical protein
MFWITGASRFPSERKQRINGLGLSFVAFSGCCRTELGVKMELEMGRGGTEIYPRLQALGCERSISLTWCQPNRQQPLALMLLPISLGLLPISLG